MAATFTIADEVREVLERSTITERDVDETQYFFLALPEQLARPLYQKVRKVLDGAGGKWDRRHQHHIFTSDPCGLLLQAVETGKAVNRQQLLQAFYTPFPLAESLVKDHMAILRGDRVLEPSAGYGALAMAAAHYTGVGNVQCYDIDPEACAFLHDRGFDPLHVDFLTVKPDRRYDHVCMNPPFTNGQDMQHVLHAMRLLRPGGHLLAIMSATAGDGNSGRDRDFRMRLTGWNRRFIPLPDKAFSESGTDVRTKLLLATAPESQASAEHPRPAETADTTKHVIILCPLCAGNDGSDKIATHLAPFIQNLQRWVARKAKHGEVPRYCKACADAHTSLYNSHVPNMKGGWK